MTKKQFFKKIIKQALDSESITIDYAYHRFKSEKSGSSWLDVLDWIQGLSLDLPFENYKILEEAFNFGLFTEKTRQTTQDNFIHHIYWQDLARELYSQFNKVHIRNLKEENCLRKTIKKELLILDDFSQSQLNKASFKLYKKGINIDLVPYFQTLFNEELSKLK